MYNRGGFYMDESKKYETFFDIGVSENNNKKFAFM